MLSKKEEETELILDLMTELVKNSTLPNNEKPEAFKRALEELYNITESERTYSATEAGNILGLNKSAIGKLANKYNLKVNKYGAWYKDKSPYSHKEVDSFRYNEKGLQALRNAIIAEEQTEIYQQIRIV